MTAAFAFMLAASMPIAYAQTTTTTSPPATTGTATATPPSSATTVHTSVPANHIMPGQIRATQMDGSTVYDAQGKNIGTVKDIILDKQGKVAAVVLDVGSFLGMGGKHVAVAMNDLKIDFDNNNKPKFSVDMTKDQLKAAQAFDLSEKTATTGSSTAPGSRTVPPRDENK
jgi:sporulation protein YlmC with PRC-barrel domain